MVRTRVKGTYCKGATNPEAEPNFYEMVSFTKLYCFVAQNPSFLLLTLVFVLVMQSPVYGPDATEPKYEILSSEFVLPEDQARSVVSVEEIRVEKQEPCLTANSNESSDTTRIEEQVEISPLAGPSRLVLPQEQKEQEIAYLWQGEKETITTASSTAPTEVVLPDMDCASTYTSSASLPGQQGTSTETGNNDKDTGPSFIPLAFSLATHPLDDERLYLPNYGADCLGSRYDDSSAKTLAAAGAFHQARQQVSDISLLLDDFVQDWIPNTNAIERDEYNSNTDDLVSSRQDQNLRSMLDLILSDDDDPTRSFSNNNNVVPI